MLKLIECPRDAMQGLTKIVPTELKIQYINALLKVGFDTIDFGSFVSTKAVPQMHDTIDVIKNLDLNDSYSALLAIVANLRGAEQAIFFDEIDYIGFPFSVSETFQQRNANSSIEQSLLRVEEINNLCVQNNRELVVYLSMAFGNPYGDPWNEEIVAGWAEKLADVGIHTIALSDTVGVSTPESISRLFTTLILEFDFVEFGAHLHSNPSNSQGIIKAAYEAGCRRFDSAMMGFGGCPMAEDSLTGNIATETLIDFLGNMNEDCGLDLDALEYAKKIAARIFGHY
ncbi:MAG: hydroxymethylglutaryl-CoA lyase [Candidatus Kapabacteria bacterium]|nr:hydroxymethylglutaryl-CoA lyase [Ignavibacteriota bacterium]MCW5883458.1 hydroxymethylglutaryl-CoA lyase [Candidatus Kapabacteria bacterium]